jgi:type I restriction enzyme M protein
LEPEHAERILKLYRDYESAEGTAKVATPAEISGNEWNLNIPRYVEPVVETESITVGQAMTNLEDALRDAYKAEDRLRRLLREAGLTA